LRPPALADHRSRTRELLARRLADEFATFDAATVARCVADVQACLAHLGVDATPEMVERMAREHLVGMVKSLPPSGRAARAWDDTPAGGRSSGAVGR